MLITDAVRAHRETGKPITRRAWGGQVTLAENEEEGFFFPTICEDGKAYPDSRWAPTADDLLDDDWEACDADGGN